MTGFGAADGDVGGGRVSVEVRSVNHRFFNPSIKLPACSRRWEGDVREALRRGVARGHVTLSRALRARRRGGDAAPIDESALRARTSRQLRELQERYGLSDALDVGTMLRMPEVFAGTSREELPPEAGAELVAIVERAVAALLEMRGGGRARMARVPRGATGDHRAGAATASPSARPARVVEQRDRLRDGGAAS